MATAAEQARTETLVTGADQNDVSLLGIYEDILNALQPGQAGDFVRKFVDLAAVFLDGRLKPAERDLTQRYGAV